jgi:uncharacterized protein YjbI with pentapeptide repeats
MANQEQLDILRQDVEVWNQWRNEQDSGLRPDLKGADLIKANLSRSNLYGADLIGANLSQANLSHADLSGALLRGANLSNAHLRQASLYAAHLIKANLSNANLSEANLSEANLKDANLSGTDLLYAVFGESIFGNTDLSGVIGLDTCWHLAPSTLDIRTIERSSKLPLEFLRGCGLPETLINYLPSLLNEPIQFYSCFISYSTKDQEFANGLYADLQNKGVRCWFAPHNMQGGKKIHEQIDEAIRVYQRLLLILSPSSIESEWVKMEIAKARRRETQEKRRMLFPVRLVNFETLRDWECFDADTGKDSAREIREFYIPDFSNWKDHDCYQREFERLLRDLKTDNKAS